ncbi:MAG: hypothetical protein ACLFTT_04955 [Candidatus Hydrogenedentota bacterium]
MWHPTRQQLLAHAESLADRNAPVSASLAAHVQRCERCRREVARIRESIDLAAAAGPLEPSRDLTAQILIAAQQEQPGRIAWWKRLWPVRALAVVLAVIAVGAAGALGFAAVLGIAPPAPPVPDAAANAAANTLSHAERKRIEQDLHLLRLTPPPAEPFARAYDAALEAAADRARTDARTARGAHAWNPHIPERKQARDAALRREHEALYRRYTRLLK